MMMSGMWWTRQGRATHQLSNFNSNKFSEKSKQKKKNFDSINLTLNDDEMFFSHSAVS